MKSITVWKREVTDPATGEKHFEHNHCEDGHVDGDYPKPKHPSFTTQKAWKNGKWKKIFAHMDGNRVVYDAKP